MRSITSNRSVAKAIGVLAVIGHLLAAFLYIVFPGLEVPYPALYLFQAAWVIVLALTLWWIRDHPWRAAVLVLAGAVLVTAVRIYGEQYLGFHG
jgi:phosphate starvation-inducible membrane PsiE